MYFVVENPAAAFKGERFYFMRIYSTQWHPIHTGCASSVGIKVRTVDNGTMGDW